MEYVMTNKENDEYNYLMDKIKRKSIIEEVLYMAFINNNTQLNTIKCIKGYYQRNFDKYLRMQIDISSKPFTYGDFWFNDTGFQFKWKNCCGAIQLECISWNEVKRLLRTMLNK